MQFTGQNFGYDVDRRMRELTKRAQEQLTLGLLGAYADSHTMPEDEEAYSTIQYNSFNKIYRQNMQSFLDNAIKYRITDNPNRPGPAVKGGKGLLKGRKGQKGKKGTADSYVFGTDMRAQNLQFVGGVLAVNNNGSRVKRGTYGLALGSHTTVKGQNGFCAGKGTVASAPNQFSIGAYNVSYHNSVFEIGYGTSNGDRKTIFLVDGSGNVSAAGTFTPNVVMTNNQTSVIDDSNEGNRLEELNEFIERNVELAAATVKAQVDVTKAVVNATVVEPVKSTAKAFKKLCSFL